MSEWSWIFTNMSRVASFIFVVSAVCCHRTSSCSWCPIVHLSNSWDILLLLLKVGSLWLAAMFADARYVRICRMTVLMDVSLCYQFALQWVQLDLNVWPLINVASTCASIVIPVAGLPCFMVLAYQIKWFLVLPKMLFFVCLSWVRPDFCSFWWSRHHSSMNPVL